MSVIVLETAPRDGEMPISLADLAVASSIAAELSFAGADGGPRITKVTSLLHAFRGSRTAYPAAKLVAAALAQAGVTVNPRLAATRRGDCVELSLATSSAAQGPRGVEHTVRASVWIKGGAAATAEMPLSDLRLLRSPGADGVLWFHVELPYPETVTSFDLESATRSDRGQPVLLEMATPEGLQGSHTTADDPFARQLLELLSPWCPGLESEMISDLVAEDSQPKVQLYGEETEGVRGVSTVAPVARGKSTKASLSSTQDHLLIQVVESIVGDGWIVTGWHPSRVHTGATAPSCGGPMLREPFLRYAHHHWFKGDETRTAGDLGLYLARALVNTYDASHRMIDRWVKSWELEFDKNLKKSDEATSSAATVGISTLLSMVGEFQRKVSALQGERFSSVDRSWFPRLHDHDKSYIGAPTDAKSQEARQLSQYLDAVAESLKQSFKGIRDDVNLMMLHSLQAQQKHGRQFHDRLAKVTALLLVPTLITGVFGANTAIPFAHQWFGFLLMLGLMVCSGGLVYYVLKRSLETE